MANSFSYFMKWLKYSSHFMKWLEMCFSHFMKWLKLKIIHVLLILNILRAYIDFADTIIFVDDFYKKKTTYSSQ